MSAELTAAEAVDRITAADRGRQPWPETRRLVDAGNLLVRDLAPDSVELDRLSVFDPALVPDGIELSDDPTLAARGEIYRLAGARRLAGR